MAERLRKVSVYIPETVATFFEKYAYHRSISLSRAIRECLTGMLSFLDEAGSTRDPAEAEQRFEELLRKAQAEGRLIWPGRN